MQQQPESPSSTLAVSPAPAPGSASDPGPGSASAPHAEAQPPNVPRWLVRLELYLRVTLWFYLGLFVCYVPWSGLVLTYLPWSYGLWNHNPVWGIFPPLAKVAANGAVRGVVSGIGLLNIWFAFKEAIRHQDG
jgi:hypothetical protein